jgi:predicted DNA-binding protein YlxM (UPF0122 family)
MTTTGGKKHEVNLGPSLRQVREYALSTSAELGFSDGLEALRSHPRYIECEELVFSQLADNSDGSLEPELDLPDTEAKAWMDLIELPRTVDLERVFNLLERDGVTLDDKSKRILELYYIDGLSLTAIGELEEFKRSRQAITVYFKNAHRRIKNSSAREALKVIYR